MKRITVVRALGALAVVVALAVAAITSKQVVPPVYAGSQCSAATLNGNYAAIQPAGFAANGNSTTGGEVPWQVVGVANFDGNGTITMTYTAAVNGAIFTRQFVSGNYKLGPGSVLSPSECVGSIEITAGDDAGYAANIAVVGGGAEVFGIATGNGATAAFDMKKQ